jgi:hypothetical protein
MAEKYIIEIDYNRKRYLIKDKQNPQIERRTCKESRDVRTAVFGILGLFEKENTKWPEREYELQISEKAKEALDKTERELIKKVVSIENKINQLNREVKNENAEAEFRRLKEQNFTE